MKFLAVLLTFALAAQAQESDLRLVRTTEAMTPAQEEKALHVPEGFEAHLFASEPMINKPINMAFDARGRLWVSSTVEYPYCADKSRWSDPQGSHIKDSRDAIKILEDTDGDGEADKVTVFADGLNIPTGVLPWHKPEDKAGCITWSIPNIWYFADTDGDGICDKREVLFGPLGYEKDTHGMCSSFRLGVDGWVYATHGFNNTSHLEVRADRWKPQDGMTNERMANDEKAPGRAADNSSFRHSSLDIPGRTLTLHSGNVFRFRPDGSRVELWSAGQVNPFGLCWDRYNNLYSADCHSNPLTQLLRGAYYPSFGKPHDGLGYGPVMCTHTHGSTGLCGVLYIDGGVWGPEWDDHMILGNCVTSKINHDKITFTGSTPKANEGPDFITSDDPWFRPVDLQLGPDNALYVADFYNKIIGHYEVPLDHPGRDKERGRIWRIVKKGSERPLSIPAQTPSQLAQQLGDPNITRRKLAFGSLMSLPAAEIEATASQVLNDTAANQMAKACSLWMLLGRAETTGQPGWVMRTIRSEYSDPLSKNLRAIAEQAHAKDERILLCHLWQILGCMKTWPFSDVENLAHYLSDGVEGGDGDQVRREVFAALSHHIVADTYLVGQMLGPMDPSWALRYDAGDLSLRHQLRITLKAWLSTDAGFNALMDHPPSKEAGEELQHVLLAVQTPRASRALLDQLDREPRLAPAASIALFGHAARNADEATLARALGKAKQQFKDRVPDQVSALVAMNDGFMERGTKAPRELMAWATETAEALLAAQSKIQTDWQPLPHASNPKSESPWCVQERKCADGKLIKVLSSLDQSKKSPEKLTGVLQSKAFAAPSKFSFWICGHQGFPKAKANELNLARLVDAKTGEVLKQELAPRNDVCQHIQWDLAALTNKQVRFEIVDGDPGGSYAWLGVGRIEPGVVDAEHFKGEDALRKQIRQVAEILKMSAPVALRDRLRPFLPVAPAPPTATTPEDRKRLDTLIAARVQSFAKAKPDAAKGAQIFTANCAVCHQLKGQGGLIGPQLDGIGNRGAERLMEDVLDPNRNVDAHFQLHVMKMLDGSEIGGFVRGEVGQVSIIVDPAGQEHRLSKNEVKEDKSTGLSLMPPVFGQTIPEADFLDLMGFLLTKS